MDPKRVISVKSLLNQSCSAAQNTLSSSSQEGQGLELELGGHERVPGLLQSGQYSKKGSTTGQ